VELARQLRRAPTPEEKKLWQRLRGNRLHGLHFRRQQIIDGFIVDFYCHAAALVIEVDGPVHKGRLDQDFYRDTALRARGLHVLRVTNDEVRDDVEAVVQRILLAISSPIPVSGRGRGRGP
jgi:very-short-patch-repair endonuclease